MEKGREDGMSFYIAGYKEPIERSRQEKGYTAVIVWFQLGEKPGKRV